MAKSSRSSATKANNQRKAALINGPVEAARLQRLSARLQEIANQPKPESSDVNMIEPGEAASAKKTKSGEKDIAMEIDSAKPSRTRVGGRKRIDKRKLKKASVVFPKYADKIAAKKKRTAEAKAAAAAEAAASE